MADYFRTSHSSNAGSMSSLPVKSRIKSAASARHLSSGIFSSMTDFTFQHIEMLISAAMIYWMPSICLELIQARIERHCHRSKVR